MAKRKPCGFRFAIVGHIGQFGEAETVRFVMDAASRASAIIKPYHGEAAESLRTLIAALKSRTE